MIMDLFEWYLMWGTGLLTGLGIGSVIGAQRERTAEWSRVRAHARYRNER